MREAKEGEQMTDKPNEGEKKLHLERRRWGENYWLPIIGDRLRSHARCNPDKQIMESIESGATLVVYRDQYRLRRETLFEDYALFGGDEFETL